MNYKLLFICFLIFSKCTISQRLSTVLSFKSFYQAKKVNIKRICYFKYGENHLNPSLDDRHWLTFNANVRSCRAGNLAQIKILTTISQTLLNSEYLSSSSNKNKIKFTSSYFNNYQIELDQIYYNGFKKNK